MSESRHCVIIFVICKSVESIVSVSAIKKKVTNCPERRRDYRQPVRVTTINNYIRNLKAFFAWYENYEDGKKPNGEDKTVDQ